MDEREASRVNDAFANLEPATRVQLEAAIEEGFEDFERGDHVSAREFLEQLRKGSSSAGMARQLGVQFRPEVLLGGRFIVDFFASAVGLVVEVDGGYHSRRRATDASRDRKLRRLGCRVVRIEAELVFRDLPAAVALVRAAL